MTALASMTPAKFFGKLVASGFKPSRVQARDITVHKGDSVEEALARFRNAGSAKNRRPGQDKTLLGETLVHAEDIRRPLCLDHQYPLDAVVIVADLYKGSNVIAGSKRRIAGLLLQATDVAWSTGSGPAVGGPIMSLLMGMAGRRAAIEDLEGDGVEILRSRT